MTGEPNKIEGGFCVAHHPNQEGECESSGQSGKGLRPTYLRGLTRFVYTDEAVALDSRCRAVDVLRLKRRKLRVKVITAQQQRQAAPKGKV